MLHALNSGGEHTPNRRVHLVHEGRLREVTECPGGTIVAPGYGTCQVMLLESQSFQESGKLGAFMCQTLLDQLPT